MNYTTEEILALVAKARDNLPTDELSRELTSRENTLFSAKPREVYKDKKIKRLKDVSRDEREENEITLPSAPIGGGSQASPTASPEGLDGVIDNARENLTSRTYTGISVYHSYTPKGIKLRLNMQSAADAEYGEIVELTAELKRQERFREIKEYEGDSDLFKEFAREVINHYKSQPEEWALGRVHYTGSRSAWFSDFIIAGKIENGNITTVIIYVEDESYEIDMSLELNDNQRKYYRTGGLHGSLKSIKIAPKMKTATRKAFQP